MVNVLYAGNYKVADGILLSIMSMIKHTCLPLNIFLLTADLTDMNPEYRPIDNAWVDYLDKYVKKRNPKSLVTLVKLGCEFTEWVQSSVNKNNRYTPFMFLRLFADSLDLPSKILYLDSDIMFNGDVGRLFDYNIDDYEMGVVLDRYGKVWIGPKYFNSGVLLLNLDKIRDTHLFEKVKDICRRKKMGFPDQSALNKCVKHILYLPRRFNEQGDLRDDTIIQHFSKRIVWIPFLRTLNVKQYDIEAVHDKLKCFVYDDIYEEYYKIKNELKTR